MASGRYRQRLFFAVRLGGLRDPVEFDITLETLEAWNYAVGVGHIFSPKATVYLELGFGDRDHTLFNFTYRF